MITKLLMFLIGSVLLVAIPVMAGTADNIWPFPQNTEYGYVTFPDNKTDQGSLYDLIQFSPTRTSDLDYSHLATIRSLDRPKMCDTNAVSYRVSVGADSAGIVVATLKRTVEFDTLLTYVLNGHKRMGTCGVPPGSVHNLQDYLLYSPDSLLFWQEHTPRRSILEIGHIRPGNTYQREELIIEARLPVVIGDFSQAIYLPYPGIAGLSDFYPALWAHDFKTNSRGKIQKIRESCWKMRRRSAEGPFYCISGDGYQGTQRLNVLEDSIPRPLIEFDWPVGVQDFVLYKDSIVVLTYDYCDPEHNIQKHVVHE